MKKSRYTESQMFQILKEAEVGIPVPELCRKHGMSSASFYRWRAKYGGMEISHMKRWMNTYSNPSSMPSSPLPPSVRIVVAPLV